MMESSRKPLKREDEVGDTSRGGYALQAEDEEAF